MSEAAIELDGVTVRREGRSVERLNLRIAEGEDVALLAQDQAAVSMLLRSLNGLEQPDDGVIRVAGMDVTAASRRELLHLRRDLIGWVPANGGTFSNMTLLENVALPLRYHSGDDDRSIHARAMELLDEMGLVEKASLRAAAAGPALCKRAAYARALVRPPRILLADDPSVMLDPEGRAAVIRLHARLRVDGTTVVIADDDVPFASTLARRAVVVADGAIRYDGAFDELPREVVALFPMEQEARAS